LWGFKTNVKKRNTKELRSRPSRAWIGGRVEEPAGPNLQKRE